MTVELRPHQEKAVGEMHNGCILCGGTGVGKSITAMAYFVSKVCGGTYDDFGSMRTPKDIYVITTAKKRDNLDWDAEAIKFGISRHREVSRSGIQLTVESWNNIEKFKDVKDAFFIFDEQRVVGSGAWSQTFIKIARANEWVLLSATPGDTWLDYIPVFVANGWYKNRTEFKNRHVVYSYFGKFPKVERYVEVGRLVRLRNQVLVQMPYERHTVRHSHDLFVDYDKQLFDKVVKQRWHVYEERPLKDVAEMFSVMRKVVNSDPTRLQAVSSLLEIHPKLIVFYNFDYELEILRTLMSPDQKASPESIEQLAERVNAKRLDSPRNGSERSSEKRSSSTSSDGTRRLSNESSERGSMTHSKPEVSPRSPQASTETFAVAEWNGHKHEEIPKTDRWMYLVQYTAGSEGWNCVETNAMCFYSLTYSFKAFHQSYGRIDRLNTLYTDLHYYVLMSRSAIDLAIRKALRSKRSFNERNLDL